MFMADQRCGACRYYLQHYTLNTRRIVQVHCGHCTLKRPWHKKPDAKACDRFIHGGNVEDSFVSREYLSKELLRYMLDLELLPDIEKAERSNIRYGK